MGGCCAPAFGQDARHARRFESEAQLARRRRYHTKLRMHTREPSRAESPTPPERVGRGGLTPPPKGPRSRAETSATSAPEHQGGRAPI